MQVFKCFFHILFKNKLQLSIYIVIFLSLMTAFAGTGDSNNVKSFSVEKVRIGMIDHDNTELSKGLIKYLSSECTRVDVPNDSHKIQDMLFYQDVEYVLFIPKGFQKDLEEGKEPQIKDVKLHKSYTGEFVDMKIDTYLNTLNGYLQKKINLKTSLQQVENVMKNDSKVELQQDEGGTGATTPTYIYYFQYYAYVVIIVVILALGTIMNQFNRHEIRKRMEVSGLKQTEYNLGIALSCIVFAIGIWIILSLLSIIMYHNDFMFFEKLPWMMLNSLFITIVGVSIGYLCGYIVKSPAGLNGIGNTVSLAFAFLGGIFVPKEMMSEQIVKVAHFVPSYWYINAEKIIENTSLSKSSDLKVFFSSLVLQLAFAAAFFGIAMVIKKARTQK